MVQSHVGVAHWVRIGLRLGARGAASSLRATQGEPHTVDPGPPRPTRSQVLCACSCHYSVLPAAVASPGRASLREHPQLSLLLPGDSTPGGCTLQPLVRTSNPKRKHPSRSCWAQGRGLCLPGLRSPLPRGPGHTHATAQTFLWEEGEPPQQGLMCETRRGCGEGEETHGPEISQEGLYEPLP